MSVLRMQLRGFPGSEAMPFNTDEEKAAFVNAMLDVLALGILVYPHCDNIVAVGDSDFGQIEFDNWDHCADYFQNELRHLWRDRLLVNTSGRETPR